MLRYQDLFQQPYSYKRSPVEFHPALAREIVSIVKSEVFPYHLFETLMYGQAKQYGQDLRDTGVYCGVGISFTSPSEALTKSIFEAFERKFSRIYDPQDLVTGSYHSLAGRAVSPEAFSLVSEWEYDRAPLSYVRYTPTLKLAWKECYQVQDKLLRPVLIPATLVYAQYSWEHAEERFVPNLSPGLACHFNFKSAFLHGLHELIERDAFMITWLCKRSPSRITVDAACLAEAGPAVDYLQALGFTVHFTNITTDIEVPVILCVIEHQKLLPDGTLILGMGCNLDPQVALKRSFLEGLMLLRNRVTFDHAMRAVNVRPAGTLRWQGIETENYYSQARFLLKSTTMVSLSDIPNLDQGTPEKNLDYLIGYLHRRDFQVYFVDLTPPEFRRDFRFCLTRALISGLQPMLYESDCWRLNQNRLFGSVGRVRNATVVPPAVESLNLLPHPFAIMG